MKSELLVLCILLGGCLGGDNSPARESASTTGEASSNPTLPADPSNNSTAEAQTAHFVDCQRLASTRDFPLDSSPGSPPGNWSSQTGPKSRIYMLFLKCERISWGNFERGPISIIFEAHTNLEYPEKCAAGTADLLAAMHAVWTDDSQVAAYLNETYGLVVRFAQVRNNDTRTDLMQHVDWQWSVGGQPESVISFDQAIITPSPAHDDLRFAWFHGSSVWIMDLSEDFTLSSGQTVLTPGTLRPPTLYSDSGQEVYVGMGEASLSAQSSATLRKYGDAECSQNQ